MTGAPTSRAVLCAVLAAILATQPACLAEIKERCPLVTGAKPVPALPSDFAKLDGLLYHRAIQMMHDVRELNGSATVSFHIWFASETLPIWCGRMELLLAAVLSENPREIERALNQRRGVFAQWLEFLARWSSHIKADAERMKVARAAWDITIGVIAAYETAGALAELAATGRPPMPSLAIVGGGAAAMELSGAAYVQLLEAVRKLIASGALDAGKDGGLEQANRDFNDLRPAEVRDLPGGGRIGKLPEGQYINVRPVSSSGSPTLEIQYPQSQI